MEGGGREIGRGEGYKEEGREGGREVAREGGRKEEHHDTLRHLSSSLDSPRQRVMHKIRLSTWRVGKTKNEKCRNKIQIVVLSMVILAATVSFRVHNEKESRDKREKHVYLPSSCEGSSQSLLRLPAIPGRSGNQCLSGNPRQRCRTWGTCYCCLGELRWAVHPEASARSLPADIWPWQH